MRRGANEAFAAIVDAFATRVAFGVLFVAPERRAIHRARIAAPVFTRGGHQLVSAARRRLAFGRLGVGRARAFAIAASVGAARGDVFGFAIGVRIAVFGDGPAGAVVAAALGFAR